MADDEKNPGAGEYEIIHQWDEIHSKPNEALNYTRHRPGDVVTLSAGDAQRLVAAGSAAKKGELKRRQEEATQAQIDAAFAQLPDDARDRLLAKYQKPQAEAREVTKDSPPPKGGAGSGRDEWATYAKLHDVEVAADANRDGIIDQLKAKGIATGED
jgi:hypothetical protein